MDAGTASVVRTFGPPFLAFVLSILIARRAKAALIARGQKSPIVLVLVGSSPILGLLISPTIGLVLGEFDNRRLSFIEANFREFWLFGALSLLSSREIWLASAISLLCSAAMWLSAPLYAERGKRTGGQRRVRFPYQLAGWILLGGFGVLWLMMVVGPLKSLSNMTQVLIPLGILGYACLAIARRAQAPAADEILSNQRRSLVLYLRGFNTENRVVAVTSGSGLRGLWQRWEDACFSFLQHRPHRHRLSFERFFRVDIEAYVGPLVALGNPTDFLAAEEAVPRVYSEDAEWQCRFRALADRAACIIVAPGTAISLGWELAALREAGHQGKLFVLSAPRDFQRTLVRRGQLGKFARLLDQAGYTFDEAHLIALLSGTVLGFDAQAQTVLLATDLEAPNQHAQAIRRQLLGPAGSVWRSPFASMD